MGQVLLFGAYPVGNLLKKLLCLLLDFFGEFQLLTFQYSLCMMIYRTEVQRVRGPLKA